MAQDERTSPEHISCLACGEGCLPKTASSLVVHFRSTFQLIPHHMVAKFKLREELKMINELS